MGEGVFSNAVAFLWGWGGDFEDNVVSVPVLPFCTDALNWTMFWKVYSLQEPKNLGNGSAWMGWCHTLICMHYRTTAFTKASMTPYGKPKTSVPVHGCIELDSNLSDNNNNNNSIFILRKIHVNIYDQMRALHESKLSTLISYPK